MTCALLIQGFGFARLRKVRTDHDNSHENSKHMVKNDGFNDFKKVQTGDKSYNNHNASDIQIFFHDSPTRFTERWGPSNDDVQRLPQRAAHLVVAANAKGSLLEAATERHCDVLVLPLNTLV